MQHEPKSWLNARHSGVLAHVSSLPSATGIGNLGTGARKFVDFLSSAGFSFWQVCPVGPTGHGDSPYQSFSAFAGNPYFIDLEELVARGLLNSTEIEPLAELPSDRVDYGVLYSRFWDVLASAHQRVDARDFQLAGCPAYRDFVAENAQWLDGYTTFMALKRRFQHQSWVNWPSPFRTPHSLPAALMSAADRAEKSRHSFYQYVFFCQWSRLKRYAHQKGVAIIGDIPIYVALDSADAWQNRELFRIDQDGTQQVVAGVPPDYFSETGQLWGNPLYNWNLMEKRGYSWWIDRIAASMKLFDVLRLDHFRGFENYWAVPADAPDASTGVWENGPGMALFRAIETAIPNAKLIAEDLGYIDRSVFELRRRTGYPGMKIMQFGFGHDDNNVNLPHFFSQNQVVYTGTHDNNTTQGWLDNLPEATRKAVVEYFDLGCTPTAEGIIKAALASVARLVITPIQDLLLLPTSCRMNRPGTATGNWQWRLTNEQLMQLSQEMAPRLRLLHERYHRIDDHHQRDFSAPPLKALERQEASPGHSVPKAAQTSGRV